MTAALPISRKIKVAITLDQKAAQSQNLSDLLILGSTPGVINPIERYRRYPTIDDVVADFGTLAPEYLAGVLWFEQSPQPTSLLIGRRVATDSPAELVGATLSVSGQAIAGWQAITSGSFFLKLNTVPYAITGLDFSSAANLNAIAAVIQTAIVAKSGAGTVVWNSVYKRFEITSGVNGTSSAINFLAAPTAVAAYTFTNQPAANDTMTFNGTVVTFVAGAPSGNQCQLGGNLAATLANLTTFLRSSADAQLVKFRYTLVGSVLYVNAATAGAGGNALTVAENSTAITVSGATLTGGSGTDISTLLGGSATSSGAYLVQGAAAEIPVDSVAYFDDQFGQKWYGVTVPGVTDQDLLAISAYIEAANTKHTHWITTQEAGVLVATDTSNIAYLAKQLGYKKTAVQYSSSNPYAATSLAARILTTNYDGNNTVITLAYKQEPGIVPESLASSQADALEGFNCNVFVEYENDTAIIENGMMSSGDYIDEIVGTDWLAISLQTDLWNALYTSPTKIPQTDPGNHALVTVMENRLGNAVDNGLLAPGVWESTGFGALSTGDFMPKGYYIYAPPVAKQSKAARAARKSVAFQIAAKFAGAIHDIDVEITVNR